MSSASDHTDEDDDLEEDTSDYEMEIDADSGSSSTPAAQNGDENEDGNGDQNGDSAPRYRVPPRIIGAVEVPAIVMNLDRAIKALDRVSSDWNQLLNPRGESIELYLNPDYRFRRPIQSHNATTHNVLLKVTVPKRTGRRRKHGTDGPWEGGVDMADAGDGLAAQDETKVCSIARLDDPRVLRRKLQDNVGSYHVEAVGMINGTHRFRGLADYSFGMEESPFMQRFMDQVMPLDINKMKEFKFTPGYDKGPNVDIIPPPHFVLHGLPFSYNYTQNPYVKAEYDPNMKKHRMVNRNLAQYHGHFLAADEREVPTGPREQPSPDDKELNDAVAILRQALEERPVWTRRGLVNYVGGRIANWNLLRRATMYVGYQFKGGPWRDAIVRYGVDPRVDPAMRVYQTLLFQLLTEERKPTPQDAFRAHPTSHLFDGKTMPDGDGKMWQVCDLTEPILAKIFRDAPVRPECSIHQSGWYHLGTWAKAKGIMKVQLLALVLGKEIPAGHFDEAVRMRDLTPPPGGSSIRVPIMDINLTPEEYRRINGPRARLPRKKGALVPQIQVHKGHVRSAKAIAELGDGETEDGPSPAKRRRKVGESWERALQRFKAKEEKEKKEKKRELVRSATLSSGTQGRVTRSQARESGGNPSYSGVTFTPPILASAGSPRILSSDSELSSGLSSPEPPILDDLAGRIDPALLDPALFEMAAAHKRARSQNEFEAAGDEAEGLDQYDDEDGDDEDGDDEDDVRLGEYDDQEDGLSGEDDGEEGVGDDDEDEDEIGSGDGHGAEGMGSDEDDDGIGMGSDDDELESDELGYGEDDEDEDDMEGDDDEEEASDQGEDDDDEDDEDEDEDVEMSEAA